MKEHTKLRIFAVVVIVIMALGGYLIKNKPYSENEIYMRLMIH